MNWFEKLTGFREESPQQVRNNLVVEGEILRSRSAELARSRVNGTTLTCGRLETPSLAELRERVQTSKSDTGKLSVQEIVADVQSLHIDESNAGALFQVASQFNLLEMVSPSRTPEHGIGIYERDRTQGPACAIAAGAGTIYRNYFVPVNEQIGQSTTNQIDCLADLGTALGNSKNRLWTMKNGYTLASHKGLIEIRDRLQASTENELDELRKLLRIGIQWNTQVTLQDCQHTVSQVYCSALPVSYSPLPAHLWEKFARLILEASYEATICTAILNAQNNGNNQLFLTLLGGGAFGNATDWIIDGIDRALHLYRDIDLDIAIVSYGSSKPFVRQFIERCQCI
jgi:hypothetical protein